MAATAAASGHRLTGNLPMRLGPIAGCTLVVRSLSVSLQAYGALGFSTLLAAASFPEQRALDLGDPALAGSPCARLQTASGVWLELVEQADAAPAGTAQGWQSIAEASAELRVWSGPDGEVLWVPSHGRTPVLTRVLLATPDPVRTAAFYAGLGLVEWQTQGDGSILGSLRGGHSIRFVPVAAGTPAAPAHRAGLRCVSLYRSDASGRRLAAADDPTARVLAGPVGEAIELL